ncbi:hypothetical protein EBU02_13325 [bacterium]|nr:hypothetical protein [bacterium]
MKTANILALVMSLSSSLLAAENLADQFQNPPVEARAGVYWWWVNAFVDKAGITNDLEQLKAKGVSSVLLVNSGQHPPNGANSTVTLCRKPHGSGSRWM